MQETTWWLEHGDSTEVLRSLPTASVDALITDPPAGISFMGKAWDGAKGGRDKWIAWLAGILTECRRVMKPGAYGWVWALPRTAHWTATACEDAGFAVRDVLVHTFGTGFPKSRSLLKPASEHWILIKAPGELRELRIDENRIAGVKPVMVRTDTTVAANATSGTSMGATCTATEGRWPANFALSHDDACTLSGTRKVKTGVAVMVNRDGGIHNQVYGDFKRLPSADVTYGDADGNEVVETWQCVEGCPVAMLEAQSGVLKSSFKAGQTEANGLNKVYGSRMGGKAGSTASEGTASRFFYTAKPSTRERSAGMAAGTKNTHVTVKATSLMQHLVRLVAAPGDLILDPFAGSGTTGIAAVKEKCRFVGIEKEAEHVEIAAQRIAFAAATENS